MARTERDAAQQRMQAATAMRQLRIYIAGPVTKGDRTHNFSQACIAQRELLSLGFAPFNPMLSMMHPDAWTIPYEQWMAMDFAWIEAADALLRLPGESDGADREVIHAQDFQIPVFYCIEAVESWRVEYERKLRE